MGALTSNRKRGEHHYHRHSSTTTYTVDRFGVSKKPRHSGSMDESGHGFSCNGIAKFVVSRISRYPDALSRFRREVHAPVRRSRFGLSTKISDDDFSSKENSADRRRGLDEKYMNTMRIAMESLIYSRQEDEDRVEMGKEVIEIDGIYVSDEKVIGIDVSDDSSVEEVEIEGEQLRCVDSSGLSNEHLLRVPVHRKLYDSSKKRNDKLNHIKFEIELSERRLERLHLFHPQREAVQPVKDVAEECFVPLSEDDKAKVTRAMSKSNRRKVLVSHHNSSIDITGEELQCLCPGRWLNDEVINLYLELLKEREKREPEKYLKCHFFNTFFYKKLIADKRGYNFQSVKRWTARKKLGYGLSECEKIFVPIHKEVHWCLAIINRKDEKLQYLDSLRGKDPQVLKVLARYFVDELKDKNGMDIDISSWEQEFVKDLPVQKNGFDCGMFMVKYADFYSRDIGLCFSQEDMPYFRRRTANEILKLRAK